MTAVDASGQPTGTGLRDTLTAYGSRVRSGDVGSLSSVLGVITLVVIFTLARPGIFNTTLNFANLLNQAAAVIFIAMGLVFVLLLGEIDLSAGYTAGAAAAVLAVLITGQGLVPWPVAVLACILTGTFIGLVLGSLVAFLGIPSFVVTLAAFLGLQGVMLLVIGSGGTIPVREPAIRAVMNSNLPLWGGWVFFAVVVGGYVLAGLLRRRSRARAGLPVGSAATFWAGAAALAVLLGAMVVLLNLERSVNPAVTSIRGVPIIVPVATVVLVLLAFLLTRTRFGRHVYAVGGNTEAARRSGINVARIKITCFMLSSSLAAVGGILIASRDGSVSPSTGGAQTLLFAVGAAVIGGTSLFGGKGGVLSALFGGLVIAVIANGLPLVTSESGIQFVVTGIVLLIAASVDAVSRRRGSTT